MFGINREYYLLRNPDGKSYLGGEIPGGFLIPANKCPGTFQYLGYLDNQDRGFRELKFGLHLICPIYMNVDKVWLDYSDLMNPQIVNQAEIDSLDTEYDDLDQNSVIIYEKVPFITSPIKQHCGYRLGQSGKPKWIQEKDIPISPKTNKKMKFLCQLEYQYQQSIKTITTNVKTKDDYYQRF